MIITPYSTLAANTFVAADYPALAHYFPMTEPTGSGGITDIAGGVIAGVGIPLTANADGTITNGTTLTSIDAGVLQSPGTKKVVLIVVGKNGTTTGGVRFGSVTAAANQGFNVTCGLTTASTPNVANGTAKVTGTDGLDGVATVDQWQARCLILDFGTDGTGGTYGITQLDYDGINPPVQRAAVSLATVTGITAIEQVISFGATSIPALIQLWYFNAVPEDFKAATVWTYANAVAGDKTVYPGWKGRS